MIRLPADDPAHLLEHIKQAIDDRRVRTWSYDEDGDFTHTAEQWKQMAWLRPTVAADAIELHIIPPSDATISKVTYAVYHGRFIEMALRHFDTRLSGDVVASPLPEGSDIVG